MDVHDAVNARSSIRAFTGRPVDDAVLRTLLADASRAPSGGNVQPWRIYVVNGPSMARFREFLAAHGALEPPEYDMYPANLWEPHRTARFELGEQMYALLGIAREDKAGRFAHLARNTDFFGAPAGLFCFTDRRMGPPQWSDLGMFLQTFMLLATERGLATCAQEYWSLLHGAVRDFVHAPESEILFCGMAIGYADTAAPVNALHSDRFTVDQFATWV